MDSTLLHLSIHHIPVVLSIAGGLAVLAGSLLRRPAVVGFGALSLLLAGAASPVAYLSGRAAASALGAEIEASSSAEAFRAVVDAHAAYGLAATLALQGAGVAAGWWLSGRTSRRMLGLMTLLGLLAAGLTAAAARGGGDIRHGAQGAVTLEDLDGRYVLVGIGPQVGEDAVELHDHPEELLVECLVDDELAHGSLAGAQAGQ